MAGLHALRGGRDHHVGRIDDVGGRAVVLDQVDRARGIVRLEAPDERDRRPLEGVDVLVVVADRKQAEAAVLVFGGPPCDGGDQLVLVRSDVLVLVHQDPAVSLDQRVAPRLGLVGGDSVAPQQSDCLLEDPVELLLRNVSGLPGKARPDQAHGQPVTGGHRHAARILTEQIKQAPPDLRGGVAVVDQRQDAVGVLPPDTDEIGDAVHEDARLAGTGAGQHEDTRLFPVVGHDPGLVGVAQGFDDRTPGSGRRLTA